MDDFLRIGLGAGLQDGLNPCIFMTCSFLIIQSLWFSSSSLKVIGFRLLFLLVYFLNVINFDFGPGQVLVLHKEFVLAGKILYFFLGLVVFILAILFLYEWYLMYQGRETKDLPYKKIKPIPISGAGAFFITVLAAFSLSGLATLWPMNNFVLLIGSEGLLRGQWQAVMPLMFSYALMSMWSVWFVWALLSFKNLRASFLKIICAAVFFTASSCMILIFK